MSARSGLETHRLDFPIRSFSHSLLVPDNQAILLMKMMTMSGEKADDNDFGFENLLSLRGAVKYYFADFIRKWGTRPCLRIFLAKKELRIWGFPVPPLYRLFPENFSSKRAKNFVFCSKNT